MTTAAKQWRVDVMLGEHDGKTVAEARLFTEIGGGLVGSGHAKVSPDDYNVPEIGDEVAAARALVDLGMHLLKTASVDIEEITKEHVHLHE